VFKRAARDLPAFPKARLHGLHVKPLEARVDEVFSPAAQTAATRDRIDAGTTPWGWLAAGGALVAALILAMVTWTLRRRRDVASHSLLDPPPA
jgi:type VI protein secretion system component VasF